MLKAIIFDMDGVIIDSEPLHAKAAMLALERYNITISMDYITQFIGSTTYHMCLRMIEDLKVPTTAEELLQLNNDIKLFLREQEGYQPVPYVRELIQSLYDNGLQLFIASSSPNSAIEYVLDSLNIRRYIKGYISGTTLNRPKPAPDIFLAALKELNLQPEECMVIEDSTHGVQAACAAGIAVIGLANPNSGNQDLTKAQYLLEGFDEVDYSYISMIYQLLHGNTSFQLNTERLILKELPLEDVPQWYSLCEPEEIHKYIYGFTHSIDSELQKQEAYIHNIYRYYGFGLWGVYLKENNQLIGRCGIEYKNILGKSEYELSYLIGFAYQKQGYAIEATKAIISYGFDTLNAPRILTLIPEDNLPSQQLATKLGMKSIGTIHQYDKNCNIYEIKKQSS